MSTRILHCSTSVENYNICVEHKVAGFSNRGPQPNDLIYLAVKIGKKTFCGVRFKLDELTNFKPWPDAQKYVHSLKIKDLEFCRPFDISILSQAGGPSWGVKYMQASKPISDQNACELLNSEFDKDKIALFVPYEIKPPTEDSNITITNFNDSLLEEAPLTRESIKVQAMIAEIGERMNYKVWLPKNDRSRIFEVWQPKPTSLLYDLPLNYDDDTIKTIENIDVLWIKGRTIVRAFEIEHTTSIYSGILRMADLMALQPNLRIKAHIVAPTERKGKVMQELTRPVFKLILAQSCTFISYNSVKDLAKERRLEYMTDAVLEEFSEYAED
ncbi:hypothetical protein [Pontibacter harenae]|uniref:hypothetical protein n=1 Tax=Pontibacter harenae TaxID=2894083 RepID=UPI001E380D14|nr:hypothetical protein [Pontibacter harenae]MCC9166500.1 hypothetical protein [Pontibacter harenae]